MSTTDTDSTGWQPDSPGTPEGRRVIQLLWEPTTVTPNGRGPKPKITLEQVVQAGVELADSDGLDALSMRKVAGHLGVGAMSLYTYLPGRSELVELMIDRVYGERSQPDPEQSWRSRIEFHVRQSWKLYLAHPWLLDHNLTRLPFGPHVLDTEEALYAAIAAGGVAPHGIPPIADAITWHLFGMGRAQISDAEEARRTGVSSEAYFMARNSFWSTYFDLARYPTMSAIWEAGGFDDPAAADVDHALARLLTAVDQLIRAAASAAPGSTSGEIGSR